MDFGTADPLVDNEPELHARSYLDAVPEVPLTDFDTKLAGLLVYFVCAAGFLIYVVCSACTTRRRNQLISRLKND